MRNGQNNKRMRSRPNNNNNHNRRGQNPMTRVFESNGPDIKIRGTASHVAEKYVQLARDARSSGDPVAAENYYQHAEHYFRLIAAAQEQLRQSQPQQQQQQQQPRVDDNADDSGDDTDGYSSFGAEPGFAPQSQPQFTPREQQQPREVREPRENRSQPATQGADTGAAVDRLPSFITGGAQQQPGYDQGNSQSGERFSHRRRRRPRPEGQMPMQADAPQPQTDDFVPGND